jgi:hypothetical protein
VLGYTLHCFLNPDFFKKKMDICLASVFVSHRHKTKPKGWGYWLAFRRVVSGHMDPLDPFSLNGFIGLCRVTLENSRVYLLDRLLNGSCLGLS